jgi:hypothetical protein
MMRFLPFLFFLCTILPIVLCGQEMGVPELKHPKNVATRQYIDENKYGWRNLNKETLTLAREFKRRDSTYYVPWMIEGVYLKENAADFIGFNNAIQSLRKAFDLIRTDYHKALKTRSDDIFVYYPLYNLHFEFSVITTHLVDCYNYTNRPDSAFFWKL